MTATSDVEPMREDPPWLHPPAEVAVSRWEPVDLGAVLRGEQVSAPPAVLERKDGVLLLYERRLNAIFGETESGKTWLAQWAIAQQLEEEHHVLLCDFEDRPEAAVERLRALGVSPVRIETHLTYVNPAGRFNELARAVLLEAFELKGTPKLAVIDGVTEAMADEDLDPMSGTDVAAYYAGSPRWLAQWAAVALIDHVTKSAEGRGRWAIGSERKLSGLDGAAYSVESLRPFGRGKTGLVKIKVAKDRAGHIRQHALGDGTIAMAELKSWPDDGVTIDLAPPESSEGSTFRPTEVMRRLSAALIETPGLTKSALRGAVKAKGITIDLALELLVNEGYVEMRPGPRGAQHHHSVRAFGQAVPVSEPEDNGWLDEPF